MDNKWIQELTIDLLWEKLEKYQRETFYTAKKLPFTYTIKGGEMFVDRRSKSITKATFARALEKIQGDPEHITGPKALNVFGAPYIFAVFRNLEEKERQAGNLNPPGVQEEGRQ